jgi:cytochrome c oxidase subunit IV
MSTDTEHAVDAAHGADDHAEHGHSDKVYWQIFFILVVITALEVATTEIELGAFFLPILLGLMAVKFFMVIWWFMHLKDDSRMFTRLFVTGLTLAVAVYGATLFTFKFFIN